VALEPRHRPRKFVLMSSQRGGVKQVIGVVEHVESPAERLVCQEDLAVPLDQGAETCRFLPAEALGAEVVALLGAVLRELTPKS
jgi:hypothetical protein